MSGAGRVASEAALIEQYLAPLAALYPGALGLKDDCALIAPPPGEDLVVTVDAVAEGVHFFPDDRPEDIAWKAVAVNVSDLVAKGAAPLAYVLSLAFPEPPLIAWIERFAAGLGAAQEAFGLALAGGDTDRRPGVPLSITITAFGVVPEGRMVRRGAATAGDRLFVSGTLGDSAAGLVLRKDTALGAASALSQAERDFLLGRYLRPMPRVRLRGALLEFASAAMDISDGLAKDLGHLCKASGVRAVVEASAVPLSEALARLAVGAPRRSADALSGGDDYEILAAVPPERTADFISAAEAAGERVTEIGWLEAGEGVVIRDAAGRPVRLETSGWEHF